MASTSTNKQPLLVDRVLHNVVNLDNAAVGAIDIAGTNTAELIVDGTNSDGCIIEDIYLIARSTTPHKVNLYISTANDYLRPGEGAYIGSVTSATTAGDIVSIETLPKILAPMPQTGSEGQFRALYIPKGKALWAGREDTSVVTGGPLIGAQGGWY